MKDKPNAFDEISQIQNRIARSNIKNIHRSDGVKDSANISVKNSAFVNMVLGNQLVTSLVIMMEKTVR